MTATTLRRTGALLVSSALLASLTVATVAAPATAAKPKCAGKTATIVGTNKGEVIKGTKKADVIVAKGGHDIIYGRGGNDTICGNTGNDKIVSGAGNDLLFGQLGRDKLFGGTGRDRLLGGPGNDRLAGGPGNDACLQESGIGLRVGCERPVVQVAPPPPPRPTLIPLTGILAVAYSDIDGLNGYSTGDVLISKLVDTNGDLGLSPGDTVVMSQYPRNLAATAFGTWTGTTHIVTSVDHATPTYLDINTATGTHQWLSTDDSEYYLEVNGSGSLVMDLFVSDPPNADMVDVNLGSPGAPTADAHEEIPTLGDQRFIDVEIYA